MKFTHPAVRSGVFKLINTFEFDLEVGTHFLPTSVELFQNTERKGSFRCRMWERDLYHLQLTIRESAPKKNAQRLESDEEIFVERTWELSSRFEDFEAADSRAALKLFMDSLKKYLDRVTG